eukprot:7050740-Pyramimonas_sp.AAC.1
MSLEECKHAVNVLRTARAAKLAFIGKPSHGSPGVHCDFASWDVLTVGGAQRERSTAAGDPPERRSFRASELSRSLHNTFTFGIRLVAQQVVWERVAGVQLPNEQLAWRLALLERAQAEISQVVDDENLQSRLAAVIAGASLISKTPLPILKEISESWFIESCCHRCASRVPRCFLMTEQQAQEAAARN